MSAIFALLSLLLNFFTLVLFARVLLSWVPNVDQDSPIIRIIYQITEPVLAPVRQALPPAAGMDFSPVVVFIGIYMVRIFIGI